MQKERQKAMMGYYFNIPAIIIRLEAMARLHIDR